MHRRAVMRRLVRATEDGENAQRWPCAHHLLLFLVFSLGLLPALASANPPDPVWIPGVYDLADYDDVVVALTDLDAIDDSSPARLLPLLQASDRALPSAPASVFTGASFLPCRPRSPPTI